MASKDTKVKDSKSGDKSSHCAEIEANLKKILLKDDASEKGSPGEKGDSKDTKVAKSNGEQKSTSGSDKKGKETKPEEKKEKAPSKKESSGGTKKENSGPSSDSNGHSDKRDNSASKSASAARKKTVPPPQKKKIIKKKPTKSNTQNSVGDEETGENVAKRMKTNNEEAASVGKDKGTQNNPSGKRKEATPAIQGTLENPSAPLDHSNPSVEKLRVLIREDVHPLKKRSTKFPRAAYYCRLCEYHCDTVTVCERHIKDKRHRKLREVCLHEHSCNDPATKDTDLLLKKLPPLSDPHIRSLNKVLDKIVEMTGLTREATEHRQMLVKKLEKLVQEKLPDVKLELYGSSVNGFGLKSSDVNIDIVIPETASASNILMTIFKLLRDNESYSKVRSDFTAKIPAIYFKDPVTDVECQLSVGNALAQQTTKLLAAYCQIDDRVRKIGVCFRYLSKLCQIDKQQDGTLPAYSFSLMVVYYLQRSRPGVLPVLQELLPKGVEKRPELLIEGKDCWFYNDLANLKTIWKSDNRESVAELWVKMLKFYSVGFDMNNHVVCLRTKKIVTRDEKKWSYKKLAIEDPFSTKRSVSRSVSHTKNFDYIHERLKTACKYFGVPQTKNGPLYWRLPTFESSSPMSSTSTSKKDAPKKTGEKQSFSDTVSDVVGEAVESVKKKLADGSNKNLPEVQADIIGNIKDVKEGSPSANGERKVAEKAENILIGSLSGAFMDILNVRASEKLKSTIQCDSAGNVVAKKASQNGMEDSKAGKNKHLENAVNDETFAEEGEITPVPTEFIRSKFGRTDSVDRYGDDSDEDITDLMDAAVEDGALEHEEQLVHAKDIGGVGNFSSESEEGVFSEKLLENLKPKDVMFVFDRQKLTDGKKPAVMCSICAKEGHLKQNCPEENLPQLSTLPPLTPEYKKLLNDLLLMVPADFMPTEKEINSRKEILTELEIFIREIYPECNLCMFGSSCNGFGFQNSDLDICMTLANHDSPKNLNCVEIIEALATKLKTHKGLYNVFAITTAKVPIVKFKHRKSQIEGDISLYNTLALYNTKMLDNYSSIDDRVKVLGYIMKVFAKVCDIGDASRGSLSSYAYILMVLYFLQQCKPPVIPCLQELHEEPRPKIIIDGCNTWFFDDMKKLSKVWPGYGKNNQTVAELWLGLLRFYTEGFNFKEHVVSIRQLKPLTRFEKLWNGKSIAIEDPFDLSHNLGAGLSRKMNTYIMKAFINGRHLFGKPVNTKQPPEGYATFPDYFFDSSLLVDGQPPNDRGCRACGKIGHFARECPIVTARKEKEKKDGGKEGDKDKKEGQKPRDGKMDDKSKTRDRDQRKVATPGQQRGMAGKPPGGRGNLLNQPRPFQFPQLFYNSGMRQPFGPHAGEGRGFPQSGFGGPGGPRQFHHPLLMNRNVMFGDRHPPPQGGRPSPERFQGPGSGNKSGQRPGDLPHAGAGRGQGGPNRRDDKAPGKGLEKTDKPAAKTESGEKVEDKKGDKGNLSKGDLTAQEKLERGIAKGLGRILNENQSEKKPGPGPSPGMMRGGGEHGRFQKQGMGFQDKQNRPFQDFGDKGRGHDRGFGNRQGMPGPNQKPGSSIQEQFHAKHGGRPGLGFDKDGKGFTGLGKSAFPVKDKDGKPVELSKPVTIRDSKGRVVESQDVRMMMSDKNQMTDRNRDRSAGRKDRAPSQEPEKPMSFQQPAGRPVSSQLSQSKPFVPAQNKDRPFSSPQKPSTTTCTTTTTATQPMATPEPVGRSPVQQSIFGSPPKKPAVVTPTTDQPGPKPVSRTVNIAPMGRGEKRPFAGPPTSAPWRPPVPGQVNILQRPPGGAPRPPFPILQQQPQQDTSDEQKPIDTSADTMPTMQQTTDSPQPSVQPPSITQYSHLPTNRPIHGKEASFGTQFMHPNAHPIARTSPVHNRPVSPPMPTTQQLFSNTSPGHTSPRRPDMKDLAMKKRRSPPKEPPPRFQKLRQHEHQPQDMHGSPRPADTAPSPNPPPVSAYLQPSSIPQPLQQSPQQTQLAQNIMPLTPHQLSALIYIQQQQQQQRLFQNQQQPEKDQSEVFGQRQEATPFSHQILGTTAGFQGQHLFPLQQQQFDPFRDQTTTQPEQSQNQNFTEKNFAEQYPSAYQSQEQPVFDQPRQGDPYFREPQQQQQQQTLYFGGHTGQYSPQNQENFYHPASQPQSTAITGTPFWYTSPAQQHQQQSQQQHQQQSQQPQAQQTQQQTQQQQQHFPEESSSQLFSYNLNQSRGQLSPNTQAEQGSTIRDPWTSHVPQPHMYDSWMPQNNQPRFDQQPVPVGNRITPVPDDTPADHERPEGYHATQFGFGLGRGLNLEYQGN